MKVKVLLTTLMLALLSTTAIYAHDGNKGSCCKNKCTAHKAYTDDCDFCGMFRGWGGWRHCGSHRNEACCSKEVKKAKECSAKSCEDGCHHSWRSHRASWRHNHYYHHDHNKDSDDRG